MIWLATITISFVLAIFLVRQGSRGKSSRTAEWGPDWGRESGHGSAPSRGNDMKKWKDVDYSR
jgi:hypothetical protein